MDYKYIDIDLMPKYVCQLSRWKQEDIKEWLLFKGFEKEDIELIMNSKLSDVNYVLEDYFIMNEEEVISSTNKFGFIKKYCL